VALAAAGLEASGLSDTGTGKLHFCANRPQMRGDGRGGGWRSCAMTHLQKFQRACRVFLVRLVMVYGTDAPEVLRRMADELEWLNADVLRDGSTGLKAETPLKRGP